VTSYDFISGTGSGDVNEAYTISLIDGLINADFRLILNLKLLTNLYSCSKEIELKKTRESRITTNPKPTYRIRTKS
jgi:beta-glucosidase